MAANNQAQVVDFAYLEGFAANDMGVVLEVLTLFCQQAEGWRSQLDSANPDWRSVAHTIKGAARGIGARPLGDVCETAEFGAESDLPPVREALVQAVEAIEAYRAEKG